MIRGFAKTLQICRGMVNNSFLIVIIGPTGSGKSDLAMQIAQQLPCEIISADSMQVYKGMDIGTAKPTRKEQDTVKHHLIDLLDIQQRLDVYFYVEKAKAAIKTICHKNKIPLIVGGSGMYIRGLIYGLDPLPASASLKTELCLKYRGYDGQDHLRKDIAELDPKALEIFGNNQRKLLRALEVLTLTGKSITQQQQVWENNKLAYPAFVYYVVRERTDLFERIENRTVKMLSNGWIDEANILIKKGLLTTPTARQAIGYGIISKYLSNKINYDEMRIKIISATKRYARRQETWFNNKHPEARKIPILNNTRSLVNKIINDIENQ